MRCTAGLVILFCASIASAQQQASDRSAQPDPKKVAAIEELFSVQKLDQLQHQMVSQLESVMTGQIEKPVLDGVSSPEERDKIRAEVRTFEKQLFTLVEERVNFDKLKPEYIKMYDQSFTSEELSAIISFYKSPAGQAYLQKLPVLTTKSVELASKLMAETMPEIQKMTTDWVESMKKKYPEPAAK